VTLRKNVAGQKVPFVLVNASTGAALTGATVTAKITLDGAAQATASGTVAELAGGQYVWSPAQADTNANSLGVLFTATSAIPVGFTIFPTSADPTDSVRLGLTALPNATAGSTGGVGTVDANNAIKVQSGTGTGQISITSGVVSANTTQLSGTAQTARDLGAQLDATVSSRLASASISLTGGAVTVGTNNDKSGYSLSAAGVQAVWDALTSALTTVGSIGKLLVDNINATISSRLASAGYSAPLDAAGTRSALGLASANLDTQLDALPTAAENASAVRSNLTTELGRIDVAISTRGTGTALDAAGVRSAIGLAAANLDTQIDALPTAAENAAAVRSNLTTELGRIDAATSTRLASTSYTAPLDASGTRAAVGLASANLDTQLADLPTAGENASAVWEESLASHTSAGTYGGRIVRASSASVELALTGSHHAAADIHELQPGVLTAGDFAADAITAAAIAADVGAEIASAVRSNLATELARVDVSVSSRLASTSYTAPDNVSIAAIKVKTDALPSDPADQSAVEAAIVGLLTTQLAESYAADGVAPTVGQALLGILQRLTEFSIDGTTITVKRLDGAATAYSLTLDDATAPTSSTRS